MQDELNATTELLGVKTVHKSPVLDALRLHIMKWYPELIEKKDILKEEAA